MESRTARPAITEDSGSDAELAARIAGAGRAHGFRRAVADSRPSMCGCRGLICLFLNQAAYLAKKACSREALALLKALARWFINCYWQRERWKIGAEAEVIHFPAIKPLDETTVLSVAQKNAAVVTAEERAEITLAGLDGMWDHRGTGE